MIIINRSIAFSFSASWRTYEKSHTMDDEPNSDDTPPTKRMKITPPIHQLPNELLVKIIEKLPRTQWTALELVDHKLRDAVLLAWESIGQVDIERDFIYSDLKAVKVEDDSDYRIIEDNLRRQIARKTETILKKLIDSSPNITSLCGLALITDDPTVNSTAVQYISEFKHLETIKFTEKKDATINGCEFYFMRGIPSMTFLEFIESTQSRATLKEIYMEQSCIDADTITVSNFEQRLRAAFANVPTRQLLQLESISMRIFLAPEPFTFFDTIDASKLTKLSLGDAKVEPAVLANLVNGAPHLQHIDFAFLRPCDEYDETNGCQGGRLLPNKDLLAALESHPTLTSLGFNLIWDEDDCACHRFETEFKSMLLTIAPRLGSFVFKPRDLPDDIHMGEIRDIIQHMPNLKSITLDKWCAMNPEDLRGIADLKELEEIEIAPYYHNAGYRSILNEVLSTIISESPRLQRFIGVGYCPDKRVVVELCKLSDLIDLRIDAYRLTEICFFCTFSVFLENLEVLHVGRIGDGVESGLIKLIGKATQLRELELEGNVTDRLLECVSQSCPNLEKFWIRSDGVTFAGLQMLVDHCPQLRWLQLRNASVPFAGSLKDLKVERYRKLEFNNNLQNLST